MKENKFRQYVWDTDSKTDSKMLCWEELLNDTEEDLKCVFATNFSNASELMQYINYKDLNGEELYEGDIIHYHRHEGWYVESVPVYKLGVITWDNNALGYRIFPIDTHSYKVNYGVDGQKIRTSHRVIKVGNIYESNIEELVKKFKNGELD